MWKIMVIICTLGNPCSIFQEDPMTYYKNKAECIAVAQEKEALLIGSFMDVGYTISSSVAQCDELQASSWSYPDLLTKSKKYSIIVV
jgi:hypothetical protein